MNYIYTWILLCLWMLRSNEQSVITKCTQLSFLPQPKNITCSILNKEVNKIENPCNILYKIKNSNGAHKYSHFVQLIQHQQYKTFRCQLSHVIYGDLGLFQPRGFKYIVQIQVADPTMKTFLTTKQQAYYAKIQNSQAFLKSNTYVGFVRALQTFMQSITCDKYKVANCKMTNLPIQINDQPAFPYRSIMIDSSRHFLPIRLIYETIDALMYNKMSVLHWHIVDEDSFPLKLESHPQIADHASFSSEQVYLPQQIKEIIRYAQVRGVRVIPEIDTPGHAASWSRSPENKNLACVFGGRGYQGPLDITLDATYKLVKEVFQQVFQLFPDPYVHLGGDEVILTCLANKTEFLKAENIKQFQMQLHYRKKQRVMLKELNPNKKFIYWANGKIEFQAGDIVHWWGAGLPPTNLQVIISQYGPFYLDMGVGNYFAASYGVYATWLDIYNLDIGRMITSYNNSKNVLGAELTLWSQISNQYTHHLKIWIRSSSLAERVWIVSSAPPKPDFFRRITSHQRLMNRRGIPTAPATCQQCEVHPEFC